MGTLHEEKLVHLFTSPIIKHEWGRSQALNRELSASIVKHARTTSYCQKLVTVVFRRRVRSAFLRL